MGRGRGVGNKFLKGKNVKKRKTCFDDFSFNNFQNKIIYNGVGDHFSIKYAPLGWGKGVDGWLNISTLLPVSAELRELEL